MPTQAYLQHNFIYRPSWEKPNKKGKYSGNGLYGNRGIAPFSFTKTKSKNKHRNTATGQFAMTKMDGKSKQQRPMTSTVTSNWDFSLKMEIGSCEATRIGVVGGGCGQSGSMNKYESSGRHMHMKEEPISDSEVRNESESDTDSDNEKKKSSKKSSHEKSSSKKSNKSQKSRKSTDKTGLLHKNPAISDDNSNDSTHNFAGAVKSEAYQKTNIKSEMVNSSTMMTDGGSSSNNNAIQQQQQQLREEGVGGQPSNVPANLDKSSSSVEEFDNEKPTRVVKVSINLDYDSEVYNDEVNIRRFHKYQRNMEIENTLQVTSFDSSNVITAPVTTPLVAPGGGAGPSTELFPYESNIATSMLDCSMQIQLQHQQQMVYSSSDSDSDDSDGNDLDDSDNSSCDECAVGPCSTSVLPPLQNGSLASSPAMSMSSYYNKNGELSFCIFHDSRIV